jgi:hypothetical protein
MNSITMVNIVHLMAAQAPIAGHAARVGFIVAVLLIFLLTIMVIVETIADQRLGKWINNFNYAVVPLLIILGVLVMIQLAQLLHIL